MGTMFKMTLLRGALKSFHNSSNSSLKFCTTAKTRVVVDLVPKINEDMEKEIIHPRRHPGVVKPRIVSLPAHIIESIRKSVGDFPLKGLHNDGAVHGRYLKGRHIPIENKEVFQKRREFTKQVLEKMNITNLKDLDSEIAPTIKNNIKTKTESLMFRNIYNWSAVTYDPYKALVYLIGRSAQEYSVIHRIFGEIMKRNPEFKPRSFFDFGAGVGSGTWAAAEFWKQSLYEYYLVDASGDMNNLSDLVLRNGDANRPLSLRNVYHRQFLPSSSDAKFDVVLSAYTLFELPSEKKRLETLLTLWNKCDGYLILIEQGTKAGFTLINEARDFILDVTKKDNSAHVFAPCPHDEACPRYTLNDGTPCNFASAYTPLPIGEPEPVGYDLYSYIVFKKGPRSTADEDINWQRIVRPVLVRTQHAICRLCTERGRLEEVIFSKTKHSKYTYRCARSSEWGDRLPMTMKEVEVDDTKFKKEF